MKSNQFARLILVATLVMGGSSWAGEVGHESAQGSAEMGAGALSAISSPLVVSAGIVTADKDMVGKGLGLAAKSPVTVLAGLGDVASGTVHAVANTGKAIGEVIHSAGEKVMDANMKYYGAVFGD